jgi:hypothetical protein
MTKALSRPENSKKFVIEKSLDELGNWRERVVYKRQGFDEVSKGRFLECYSRTARLGESCDVAEISVSTFKKHLKTDTDFADACLDAEEVYRCRLSEKVQELIFDGIVKEVFDRNGNLISKERTYPIPLLLAELKRVNPEYRESRQVDVKVSGGVLIAPADVPTIKDWERKFLSPVVIEGET